MDSSITINEFAEKYIKVVRTRLRSHRQIERHFNRYTNHFNNRPINTIKRNDLAEYAEHRQAQGVTTDSINIELAVYSAAINYAKKRWEIELTNPISGLYYPHKPGRLRYLEKQALCEIQWVIEFHFSAEEIDHVDKVFDISIASGASFC